MAKTQYFTSNDGNSIRVTYYSFLQQLIILILNLKGNSYFLFMPPSFVLSSVPLLEVRRTQVCVNK